MKLVNSLNGVLSPCYVSFNSLMSFYIYRVLVRPRTLAHGRLQYLEQGLA